MSVGSQFVQFLIPFVLILLLWGLIGKLLEGKKFTAIFTDYPAVATAATYTVLTFACDWNVALAMVISFAVNLLVHTIMFFWRRHKENKEE